MKAQNLLTAITCAILAAPDLHPIVNVNGNTLDVDPRPFDPAPLIGQRGSIKWAIQHLMTVHGDVENTRLNFVNTGEFKFPRVWEATPDTKPVRRFVNCLVDYWREEGFEAEGLVETSKSTVVVMLMADPRLSNSRRDSFIKICRAIGKAHGFPCIASVESLTPTIR